MYIFYKLPICSYFFNRQVLANRVYQIRLIRVYTVCYSICIFWTSCPVVKQYCSNFRIIRALSSKFSTYRLCEHTSSESSGTFRQKARSLVPLNGCARTVKICHDGMLEDANSLDVSHYSHFSGVRIFRIFTVD